MLDTNISVLSAASAESAQIVPATFSSPEAKASLKQLSELLSTVTGGQITQIPDSVMELLIAQAQNPTKENRNKVDAALLAYVPETGDYDAKTEQVTFKNTSGDTVSVVSLADLLALLAQIIESEQKLRNEVMQNSIAEGVAIKDFAQLIAADKCSDAQRKFGITLAVSVATMALSTAATVKMAQPKSLSQKHLSNTSGQYKDVATLKDKNPKLYDEMTATLQQNRTHKYQSVAQMSNSSGQMAGNANEIQHADQVRQQEEMQASKDFQEKRVAQLNEFIQNLTQSSFKWNDVLDAVAKASLATNR